MTDDTPLERLHADIKRKAYAAALARMTRMPDATTTGMTPVLPGGSPSLEEEHAALVKAGVIEADPAPTAPARASTLNQDIADELTAAISSILNAQQDGTSADDA